MSDSIQAVFEQGVTAHREGRIDLAEQLYRQVLVERPEHASALSNLGSIFVTRGQLQEAIKCYQDAIKSDPNRPDGFYNLGNLLRKLGRLTEAETLYRKSLANDAEFGRSHHNLGLVLGQMGRWQEAIPCYENALRLDPQFVEAHNLLGQALMQVGKLDAAISRFQRYTRLQPNDPRGFHNLALALAQKDSIDSALAALQSALKLKPDYAEAFNVRAVLRWKLGQTQEAIADWRQAIAIQPTNPEYLVNLAAVSEEAGDLDFAIGSLRKSIENYPNSPIVHSGLLRLYNSVAMPPEQLFAEHVRWAERFADPVRSPHPPRIVDRNPDRILNVGYVVGEINPIDARSFIQPLLHLHDRSRVRVTAFTNSRSEDSKRWLKKEADHVLSIAGMNDAETEHLIVNEKIDILVDLAGHVPGNRLGVFAIKAVPIQVSLYGYPNTTGMKAMDYRITDAYSDPPGTADMLYTEKLWRLPRVSWAWQPPQGAPEPGPSPFERNGYITFGMVQAPRRILPGMIEIWSAILKAEPTARLKAVLGKNAFAKDRFQQLFSRQGVEPTRIDFLPRLPETEYFQLFREIDISFDTFPANGRLSVIDALYMGVPTVSLSARMAISRQGLSLLRWLDLNDLAAWKPEQYIEVAVKLAQNRDRLQSLRGSLRPRLLASPICDWTNYIRDLESAYRGMWQKAVS